MRQPSWERPNRHASRFGEGGRPDTGWSNGWLRRCKVPCQTGSSRMQALVKMPDSTGPQGLRPVSATCVAVCRSRRAWSNVMGRGLGFTNPKNPHPSAGQRESALACGMSFSRDGAWAGEGSGIVSAGSPWTISKHRSAGCGGAVQYSLFVR